VLTIRKQQLQVFEQHALAHFEERALAHLRSAIPVDYARVGETAARHSIRSALRKSKLYGFTNEFEVLTFLNLMYLVGLDFDEDPAHPWARDILTDPRLGTRVKISRLLARVKRLGDNPS